MPGEKRKPLEAGFSLLDSMRARFSRLTAKPPKSREPHQLSRPEYADDPSTEYAAPLSAAHKGSSQHSLPKGTSDGSLGIPAGPTEDKVSGTACAQEQGVTGPTVRCDQSLKEWQTRSCGLDYEANSETPRLVGYESGQLDASVGSLTSRPAAQASLQCLPSLQQSSIPSEGRLIHFRGAARDPRIAGLREAQKQHYFEQQQQQQQQQPTQESYCVRGTEVPALGTPLNSVQGKAARSNFSLERLEEARGTAESTGAVRGGRDPRQPFSVPLQQHPALPQWPVQEPQHPAEHIWPPVYLGRAIPEEMDEQMLPECHLGYDARGRFEHHMAGLRYHGLRPDLGEQVWAETLDRLPMYPEQRVLEPLPPLQPPPCLNGTHRHNAPLLRGRPITHSGRLFAAAFRQPVYNAITLSAEEPPSDALADSLAFSRIAPSPMLGASGPGYQAANAGYSYEDGGEQPLDDTANVLRGVPFYNAECPVRNPDFSFWAEPQQYRSASQQQSQPGRSILSWSRQSVGRVANTRSGKLPLFPEAETMGRAAADLGFVPKPQKRQAQPGIATAASGPWNNSCRSPLNAASHCILHPSQTAPSPLPPSGFRVLSAPSARSPQNLPGTSSSLAVRSARRQGAAAETRAAPQAYFGNASQISGRIAQGHDSLAALQVLQEEEEEEESRSDESSAQTVACGPPARPRRGSDQAFTESKRPRLSTLKRADQLNVNSKALESDDEECSRSRSALDRRGKLLPQGKNGSVGLSLESLAAAAFLAKKHTFKPLKLSVTRTKRQACIANLHTAWKQSRLKLYRFVVRPSRIVGLGVFCTEDIEEGELLMEYGGEIIRRTVADVRERRGSSNGIYFFALSNELVIDATHVGGIARFINHCCQPNCWAKEVAVDGSLRILILAAKKIRAGDELTYDYCLSEAEEGKHLEKKIKCICGAQQCRGEL